MAAGVVAALAASPFIYRKVFYRVEEEVRGRVESKIAEHFPHLKISVAAAHLTADGIDIRGVSISEPGAPGPQPEIVHIDEVFLACHTSMQELLSGDPAVSSVRVVRPVIRGTRRPDGTFSVGKLFPLPKPKRLAPPTTVENGMVVVFDPLKIPSSTLTFREINFSIKPSRTADAEKSAFEMQGYLTADHLQRIEMAGTFDPHSGRWSMGGTVDSLAVSPELRARCPNEPRNPWKYSHRCEPK